MRKDWTYKDGWPHFDPNAKKDCKICNGVGILFHGGVFSFEEECNCVKGEFSTVEDSSNTR